MNIGSYNNILNDYNRGVSEALNRVYIPEESIANNGTSNQGSQVSFGDIISNEIDKLNDKHLYADNMVQEFISGQGQDLHSIIIATEEARLSLELAVQVRNKVIEALNTVNNIQL